MQILTSDQRFRLAPHVRACASDGQVILLDLKKCAYLGIAQGAVPAGRVDDWPQDLDAVHERTTLESANPALRRLLERGLLTGAPSRRAPDPTVEEATSSLNGDDAAVGPGIEARRLARFLRSAIETSIWLRCRSLLAIAASVQSRRDRLQSSSTPCSPESLRNSTAAYERLRSFAFSAHKNCLYDSLALVAFLAAEGIFPRWVVGVKTRPFGAHSWVQMGTTVLNDQHEMVRQFRPILVV